jgi:hypothetical protein
MSGRIAGIIFIKVDGVQYDAKGEFTYNIGAPMREAITGADAVHGFTETPQVPFIEGEITDRASLDLSKLVNIYDATVTLELANGKVIVLRDGWYAGDGNVGTAQANITARFEGLSAEEIR